MKIFNDYNDDDDCMYSIDIFKLCVILIQRKAKKNLYAKNHFFFRNQFVAEYERENI